MYSIAISGKANSGKNTIFKLLVAELGLTIVKDIAFADPIKEGLLKLYPTAQRECLFGPSKLRSELIPGLNVTYRQVLCDLGAQARQYDEEHWVKILINNWRAAIHTRSYLPNDIKSEAYIVTDLRFPNEYAALKEHNFTLIRLKRDEQLQLSDVSETSQDKIADSAFDFVVENNSTLDALREKCRVIATNLKEKRK